MDRNVESILHVVGCSRQRFHFLDLHALNSGKAQRTHADFVTRASLEATNLKRDLNILHQSKLLIHLVYSLTTGPTAPSDRPHIPCSTGHERVALDSWLSASITHCSTAPSSIQERHCTPYRMLQFCTSNIQMYKSKPLQKRFYTSRPAPNTIASSLETVGALKRRTLSKSKAYKSRSICVERVCAFDTCTQQKVQQELILEGARFTES